MQLFINNPTSLLLPPVFSIKDYVWFPEMVIKNVDQATTKCSLENLFLESLDFHRLYNLWTQRLEKTFLRLRLVIPHSPEYQKTARRFQRSLQNQQQQETFLLPESPLALPCEQTRCLPPRRYSDRPGTRCKWTHQCQGGAVLGFTINASGPDKRLPRIWIPSIWHRNIIRWNSDVITFNKNTWWYFSALCTLRMSEHSGHYYIVMYKCKINVLMTTLCTGSPVTHKVTRPSPSW